MELSAYRAYLRRIDRDAMTERMSDFRNAVRANVSSAALSRKLWDVFLQDGPASFPMDVRPSAVGARYWRARPLQTVEEIRSERDLWEPPATHARAGRFNAEGSPLLYTSMGDPLGIEREARIADKQLFTLTCFIATAPIKTLFLSHIGERNALSPDERATHALINRFIGSEIFRPSTEPRAHTIAQFFLSEMFDLPAQECNAWLWESVESPDAINVAVRPEAAHCLLRISKSRLCRLEGGRRVALASFDMKTWADRNQPPPWSAI